ncbi:hypothetical protein KL915_005158 [Ogataea haglerorum]|nr:hypothetical protein KL915_005158 [Ogataea haglerorum]
MFGRGPLKNVCRVVLAAELRETQHGQHQQDKKTPNGARHIAEPPQVPGARLEGVSGVGDSEKNRHRERHKRACRAEREHRVYRLALEHQTQQTLAHKPVEPHRVDRRPGVRVNAAPHARQRDAPVSGVRVQHARRGEHAGEVHDVRQDDGQGGHRDSSVSREDLAQERHERLPQLSVDGSRHVDDRVRHAELEREAEHGAERRGQHDRVRRHNLGVRRLLSEMERSVEAGHDPDSSHEAHQDGHSVGPVGHVGDGPRLGVGVELWQALLGPRVAA